MKNITTESLRRMNGREGLILQGCGCHSYDEALCIIGEYVNITSGEDYTEDMGGMRL